MALASLLFGVFGCALCGVGALLGSVFGFVALSQINKSGGQQSGRGMAIAGIVIGLIMFIVFVFAVLADLAKG
jgi:uncharacterized membrane protein